MLNRKPLENSGRHLHHYYCGWRYYTIGFEIYEPKFEWINDSDIKLSSRLLVFHKFEDAHYCMIDSYIQNLNYVK